MCSQVSSGSLFRTPIPALLLGTCTKSDGQTPAFTPANTLLDVFVAGCLVFGSPGVVPTQPDGAVDQQSYHFDVNPALTVTGCTRNGAPAVLADCLAQATYSSYFKFAADRVIIKRE